MCFSYWKFSLFLLALATLKPQAGIVAIAPTPVAPAIPNVNVSLAMKSELAMQHPNISYLQFLNFLLVFLE